MTTITCACGCGRSGRHDTSGWIGACATRWRKAGRPDTGPPPPHPATEARRRKYAALAALGRSKTYIAWRLSVSIRTVERYAAAHRTQDHRSIP